MPKIYMIIERFENADAGHYLLVTGPGKWAYQPFGGLFKSWAATRPLSDQELAMFENFVKAT
jgi:hypothetical protein